MWGVVTPARGRLGCGWRGARVALRPCPVGSRDGEEALGQNPPRCGYTRGVTPQMQGQGLEDTSSSWESGWEFPGPGNPHVLQPGQAGAE